MSVALRGATLIDGTGGPPVRDVPVVVEGDRIARVGGSEHADNVVDLSGLTLLPGLIDAHTHFGSVPATRWAQGTVSLAEIAAQIFENCALALDAGFTTCRELGGVDGGVADAVERGLVRGPRILPSGPFICQDGGAGSMTPAFAEEFAPLEHPGLVQRVAICDGPDAVRVMARKAFRRGATQLKLMATGAVVSLTDEIDQTQFTVDELHAAVVEAEARGTYVTIHAHNSAGIRNGIAAGVKCVEHGTYLDEETAKLMAERGIAYVPTLSVTDLLPSKWSDWGLPGSVVGRIAPVMERTLEAVRLARRAGVLIGSGSDLLGAGQNERGGELVLRGRLEDPMTAIVSATSVNARIIRRDHLVGSVRAGLQADLIAVTGDPLADVGVFGDPDNIVLVIKGGRVVKDTRDLMRD